MSDAENFLEETDEIPRGDSAILKKSVDTSGRLRIYSSGEITVVGFGGQDVPSDFWIGQYKDELIKIVHEQKCRELAFDLSGVVTIPSGVLGLLSSLSELGVAVSIYNPSDNIREILRITKLSDMIDIREVDVNE